MSTKKNISVKKYEPKSANKRGNKLTSKQRKALILDIKKKYEQGRVNKLALARELNINRGTLMSLISELDIEMQDLPTIKVELKLIYERLRDRAMYLLDKLQEFEEVTGMPDIKGELKVMNEIQSIVNNFYKLLQELGEAPKAVDNIAIKGEFEHNINVNYTNQRNFIDKLENNLRDVVDEKKRQEIVVNMLEDQKDEIKNQ